MKEAIASTTVFSLSSEPPGSLAVAPVDGDNAYEAAWLTSESQRHDCLIRKFSAGGAALRIAAPIEPGELLTLELPNGQAIEGHVSWAIEDEAVFVFDAPADVVSTLARNLARMPDERRRVPRVELRHAVGIRHGELFEIARTRDLSQAGLGIETRLPLSENDEVQVAFDGLRTMAGTVRWARDGKAGIFFESEIPWQHLMPWLRAAQRSPSHPPAPRLDESRDFGLGKDKTAIRLDAAARVRTGVHWWNVHIRMLSPLVVEFDATASFAKGTQLWIALPGTAGWPASVVEANDGHYLAEFRLPLRKHDLDQLGLARLARS